MGWLDRLRRKRKIRRGITSKGVSSSSWSMLPEQLTAQAIRGAIGKARSKKAKEEQGVNVLPRIKRIINDDDNDVVVEAVVGTESGHGAEIVLKKGDHREVLAKTDQTYATAEEAVGVAQAAIDDVRGIKTVVDAEAETEVAEGGES